MGNTNTFTFGDDEQFQAAIDLFEQENVAYMLGLKHGRLVVEDNDEHWFAEGLLYRAGILFNNE